MKTQFHRRNRDCLHHRSSAARKFRGGAAAVEMALVCPIVVLFALATTDLGRIAYTYLVVSNAARCGAEYGGQNNFTSYTQSSWQTQVTQAVNAEMQNLAAFDSSKLQVVVSTAVDSDQIYQISVDVKYPFNTIVNWPWLPSSVLIDHQVQMRQTQ